METIDAVNVKELKAAVSAIVKLKQRVPMPRDIHFQVTLDPKKISPSREFIRLGDVRGDELTGWQPVEDIEIIEILGVFEPNEKIPYIHNQAYAVTPGDLMTLQAVNG